MDAIYIVEYRSISQGVGVLDKMVKHASLALLYANPICIGKYLICVGGEVDQVEQAQKAAEEGAEEAPMASRLITGTHHSILEYFKSGAPGMHTPPPAIGLFETRHTAWGFASLDQALKSSQVVLMRLWLGQMLGGKFCYVLGGSTSDVQSALLAAAAAVPQKEQVGSRIIPGPDEMTLGLFLA